MKRIDIRKPDPTDDVELVMTRRQARLLRYLVGGVTDDLSFDSRYLLAAGYSCSDLRAFCIEAYHELEPQV